MNIDDVPISITPDEARTIARAYDHHIREVLPVLAAMLGVDIYDNEDYRKYVKSPAIWNDTSYLNEKEVLN